MALKGSVCFILSLANAKDHGADLTILGMSGSPLTEKPVAYIESTTRKEVSPQLNYSKEMTRNPLGVT